MVGDDDPNRPGAEATPEQAEVFLNKISELLEKLNDRRNHQSRIRGIDRDADEFARDVTVLAARVARDLIDRPARELAENWLSACEMHRQTQSKARRSSSSASAKRKVSARPRLSTRKRGFAWNDFATKQGAPISTIFPRPSAAHRISSGWKRLAPPAKSSSWSPPRGPILSRFVIKSSRRIPTALDASIEELEATIATQEEELRRLDQTIGAERGELARMDGSDRAAQTAEDVQTLLARLQGDVARYATLKLAATVMHRGIERYREKNQGPILARASVLFAGLTGGSFARLQIDDDGDGRSVLKGRPARRPARGRRRNERRLT